MELPLSRAEASRLEWVDAVDSTNTVLVARASGARAAEWPHLSALATTTQTAGRGRLGRDWVAPPGGSLAVSVLLRPQPPLAQDALGWLPLVAGLAMARAVRGIGERHEAPALAAASLKWPNDVLVPGPEPREHRKLCGILCELLPDGGVVAGAGLNLSLAEHELPVPTATSLALAGARVGADEALAAFLRELRAASALLEAGDMPAIRDAVSAVCHTLGRAVRVLLPGGASVTGAASGLGADGCLVVETADGPREVSAGDVTHLRY